MFASLAGLLVMGVFFILTGQRLISSKVDVYFFALRIVLVGIGIKWPLYRASRKGILRASVFLILLSLSAINVVNYASSPWTAAGYREPLLREVREWVLENTAPDDVFLSSCESSFAIFSISGRKTVLFRRTHASPFVDYNKRSADIMVALLGDNITESLEILKMYNVSYVYIDPIVEDDSLWAPVEYRGYLESRGVNCTITWMRYDPADPRSLKLQVCLAPFIINPQLEDYLTPVATFQTRIGKAIIYKLSVP